MKLLMWKMEKFVTTCARVKSNSHIYIIVWFYSFKPDIYFLQRKYIWCRLQDGGHFIQTSVLTDRDFPKTWGRNESYHWVYPGSKIIRLIFKRFAQHLQGVGLCRAAVTSSAFFDVLGWLSLIEIDATGILQSETQVSNVWFWQILHC